VTDGVDDDLFFRDLVEDEKGIWRRRQAANSGIIRADANLGMSESRSMTSCMRF
jgi:hypothetical protein